MEKVIKEMVDYIPHNNYLITPNICNFEWYYRIEHKCKCNYYINYEICKNCILNYFIRNEENFKNI